MCLLFVAVAVLAAAPAFSDPPPMLRSLGGIELGASGSSAAEALGQPAEASSDFELPQEVAPSGAVSYKLCDGAQLILLVGKIAPMQARIVQITVNGDACDKTSAYSAGGVVLGSKEQDIVAKFGAPDRAIERSDAPLKTVAYSNSNVAFTLVDGVVKSISVIYRNQMIAEDLIANRKMPELDAWKALAEMRLRGRQMDLAREAFEKVLALDPKSVDAMVKLGGCYLALNDLEKAEKQYKAALVLDASNAVATYNMGRIALRNKKPDEARKLLAKAAALDPSNPAAYNELGLLEEQDKKLDAAEKNFRRAIEVAPRASQPHQNLGRVLLQKGDKQGAIDEYRQAIVLELKSPTPNNDLIAALRKAVAVLSGEEPAPKPAEAS